MYTHTHVAAKSEQKLRQTLCSEQEKVFVYALGLFTAQGNQLIPGSRATVTSSTDEVSISPNRWGKEQQPTLPNGLIFHVFPNLLISSRECSAGRSGLI